MLADGEKKVRENRHWKVDVVYNTTSLPRRRDDRHSLPVRHTLDTDGWVRRCVHDEFDERI